MALTWGESDDLSTALTHLRAVGRIAVVGPGGIGKSHLLGQLTEALAPDDVIALDAELVDDVSRIESWLLDRVALPALGDERAGEALASLADRPRVAVVIDGADAIVDEVLKLVESIPVSANGPWSIVASRVHPLRPSGPVLRVRPLALADDSTTSPAERLFRAQFALAGGAPSILDAAPDVVDRVVKDTGGIPLAIRVAAAMAAATGLPATEGSSSDEDAADDPVAESIGRSVRMLDPVACRVFDACSVTAGHPDVGLAAALTDLSASECRRALGTLARHGLVQAEPQTYTMLPPVLRFAGRRARAIRAGLVDKHRAWCLALVPDVEGREIDERTMLANEPDVRLAITRSMSDGHPEPAAQLANRLVRGYLGSNQQRRASELLDSVLDGLSWPPERPVDLQIELLRLSAIAREQSRGVAAALPRLEEADRLVDGSVAPDRHRARLAALRAGFGQAAGDLTTALPLATEAMEAARSCGDEITELQSGRLVASILLDLGRFEEADSLDADVATRCEGGLDWLGRWATIDRGLIALERGDRATCEAITRRVLTDADASDDTAGRVDADWQLLLSDPAKWAGHEQAVDVIDPSQPGEWSIYLESQCSVAIRALVAGDAETALTVASDVVVIAESLPQYSMLLEGLLLMGDAALVHDDRLQATHVYRRAIAGANEHGFRPRLADALDGIARAMPSDWSHRDACLAAARQIRAELGAVARPRPWLYPMDASAAALPAGWTDDGRLTADAAAIVTSSEHADSPVPVPSTLSPAERRVAMLVADGCTNREIGERLHVSRRTVETHILHAFQKLGVQNRTQLARQMMDARRGSTPG